MTTKLPKRPATPTSWRTQSSIWQPGKRPSRPRQKFVLAKLTMRMHMRRFTRLTNAFSKKVENHAYAVALHMMYYNFVHPSDA